MSRPRAQVPQLEGTRPDLDPTSLRAPRDCPLMHLQQAHSPGNGSECSGAWDMRRPSSGGDSGF